MTAPAKAFLTYLGGGSAIVCALAEVEVVGFYEMEQCLEVRQSWSCFT